MRCLAFLLAALIGVAPLAAQDTADVDRARRELDRLNAEAQAQAAADRARMAHEDARRLAAEADARQQALAAEYARRRSESEAQAQAARSEADLARHAAEQRLRIAEDDLRRSEAQRGVAATAGPTPPLQPSTTAPRRRVPANAAPPQPGAGASPVIAMKEGVTLCQPDPADQWRCTGPLRVAFGNIGRSRAAAVDACGAAPIRDLGTARGLRAFACGYGLNPRSTAPGNRDVAALFGIDVPGRAIFRCPADIPAGCRRR